MKTTLVKNTTSFYMRNLHTIYNRAMEDGLVPEGNNPFPRVYTGVGKTQKRAITAEHIKMIKDYDLSDNPKMAFARDIFMLSFYLRGISFVDKAFLEKDNLKDGFLKYKRRKIS